MKKRFKKFMALVMAVTLLCSSMTVFAANDDFYSSPAEGTATGNAQLEGWVDKDVFCVNLPTVPLDTDMFSFRLDPQDLIHKSVSGNSTGFDANDVSGDGLYFTNYDGFGSGNATKMSGTSDSLKAINKGTVAVNVTLTAKATDLQDAAKTYKIGLVSSDAALASSTSTDIYLALAVSGDAEDASGNAISSPVAIVGDSATAKISGVLGAASGDAYEVTYVSGNPVASANGYKYELSSAAKADGYAGFKELTFNLVGACNQSDSVSWEKAKNATPGVEVTWTLTKAGGPSVTVSSTGLVTVAGIPAGSYPETLTFTSSLVPTTDMSKAVTANTSGWSLEDGGTITYQLDNGTVGAHSGKQVTISIKLKDIDDPIVGTGTL